jgi:hypothetical protein
VGRRQAPSGMLEDYEATIKPNREVHVHQQ